ncbi:UvrD-helicase domain-containing protein, partial [Sorangium cellulosum]|uniref:UvrD-helicase domain-containing protein n=1 Tax=Sorangium cellulosum TaxID=56 RepID=UPI0023DE0F92
GQAPADAAPSGEADRPEASAARSSGPGGPALLDALDPEQRAAAELTEGALLLLAGPGTGKTRTLTHRIAHLVVDLGVPPEQCLAITFTRRAADEMRERLVALLGEAGGRVPAMTF